MPNNQETLVVWAKEKKIEKGKNVAKAPGGVERSQLSAHSKSTPNPGQKFSYVAS